MQICHTVSLYQLTSPSSDSQSAHLIPLSQRQPILDPVDFRARFKLSLPAHLQPNDTPAPPSPPDPLPPALLCVVLAWGSKFSEHPLLILDRKQNGGRSRLSRMLVGKAIEIAEGERVYRLPTTDGILTCMIIEGIQSRTFSHPLPYHFTPQLTHEPRPFIHSLLFLVWQRI